MGDLHLQQPDPPQAHLGSQGRTRTSSRTPTPNGLGHRPLQVRDGDPGPHGLDPQRRLVGHRGPQPRCQAQVHRRHRQRRQQRRPRPADAGPDRPVSNNFLPGRRDTSSTRATSPPTSRAPRTCCRPTRHGSSPTTSRRRSTTPPFRLRPRLRGQRRPTSSTRSTATSSRPPTRRASCRPGTSTSTRRSVDPLGFKYDPKKASRPAGGRRLQEGRRRVRHATRTAPPSSSRSSSPPAGPTGKPPVTSSSPASRPPASTPRPRSSTTPGSSHPAIQPGTSTWRSTTTSRSRTPRGPTTTTSSASRSSPERAA